MLMFYSDIVLQAKQYVIELLKDMDKKGYKYHNLNHTLEVFERATELGLKEGLDEEMLEILQLAALFHDTGFIERYDNNEEFGAKIAEEWLRKQGYPEDKIEIVKKIIMATVPTNQPQAHLCEIIKDADLDNLGREDFWEKSKSLYEELKNIKNLNLSYLEWLINNKAFLEAVKFYTSTQQKERENKKQKNLEEVEKILKSNKVVEK